MRSFTNFKNGQTILQATLTQLIQYYHRFHKIMTHNAFKHLAVRNEMLSIHHLMVEIKILWYYLIISLEMTLVEEPSNVDG